MTITLTLCSLVMETQLKLKHKNLDLKKTKIYNKQTMDLQTIPSKSTKKNKMPRVKKLKIH
jgi:hypothetical protein